MEMLWQKSAYFLFVLCLFFAPVSHAFVFYLFDTQISFFEPNNLFSIVPAPTAAAYTPVTRSCSGSPNEFQEGDFCSDDCKGVGVYCNYATCRCEINITELDIPLIPLPVACSGGPFYEAEWDLVTGDSSTWPVGGHVCIDDCAEILGGSYSCSPQTCACEKIPEEPILKACTGTSNSCDYNECNDKTTTCQAFVWMKNDCKCAKKVEFSCNGAYDPIVPVEYLEQGQSMGVNKLSAFWNYLDKANSGDKTYDPRFAYCSDDCNEGFTCDSECKCISNEPAIVCQPGKLGSDTAVSVTGPPRNEKVTLICEKIKDGIREEVLQEEGTVPFDSKVRCSDKNTIKCYIFEYPDSSCEVYCDSLQVSAIQPVVTGPTTGVIGAPITLSVLAPGAASIKVGSITKAAPATFDVTCNHVGIVAYEFTTLGQNGESLGSAQHMVECTR